MRKKLAVPKDEGLQLLLDVPEREVLFGFDGYAASLVSVILGTEPRFTIGIFGDWGCGKTTLLEEIRRQLEAKGREKAVTIFFDAWRYQREEHMLLPLLDVVCQGLNERQGRWQTLATSFSRLARSVAAAITIGWHGAQIELGKVAEHLREADNVRSDYYGWHKQLQAALDAVRQDDPQRRIVVLIDDLDRCLPHRAVQVVESIKVMLDVTGFVFVIALNQEVLEKAVERYYGSDYGVSGRDYLKKLVQVEFRLPPLRPQDVEKYARGLQHKLGRAGGETSRTLAEVVPVVVGHNLREVKRFINRVLLGSAIMRSAGVTVPPSHQVAFLAMDFRWPGIMRILSRDETIFGRIRAYIEAKAEGREIPQSEEETKSVKTLLEANEGLESFLESSPGKELLSLDIEGLNELLFYSSMTRETIKAEVWEDVIDNILMTLTPREHKIIRLRFGLEGGRGLTLSEVSKEFKLSGERIRQIETRALRALRHPTRSMPLRAALGSMSELSRAHQRLLLEVFGSDWQEYVHTMPEQKHFYFWRA